MSGKVHNHLYIDGGVRITAKVYGTDDEGADGYGQFLQLVIWQGEDWLGTMEVHADAVELEVRGAHVEG